MKFSVCDFSMKQIEVPFELRPGPWCVHVVHGLHQSIIMLVNNGYDFVVQPNNPR